MNALGQPIPGWKICRAISMAALIATSCALSAPVWAASIVLDEEPVILGRTESVGITIKVDEPPGSEDRPLRLAVSVGSFSGLTRMGPGEYRSVYVPPATRFPQLALVAIWRETGPEAAVDFLRIPLHGATKIEVSTRRNSEVSAKVGEAVFGPMLADADGKTLIALVVPPGVREAHVTAKSESGMVTTRTQDIDVPPYNRLTAAVVPHAILVDGRQWSRIHLHYDLGGPEVHPDRTKIIASLGAAEFESASQGRYVYRYTPPVGTPEKEVQFAVSIEGDEAATATIRLNLGLPQPKRAILRPPNKPLPADGRSSETVTLLVLDEDGLGLPRQLVSVTANGEPLADALYQGDGLYEVPYVAPAAYPPGGIVHFSAAVDGPGGSAVSASANYQLLPSSLPGSLVGTVSPDPVPADGRTEAVLSIRLRDGAGKPLEGVQLMATANHGVLGILTDVGGGRYETGYVAPDTIPDEEVLVRMVDSTDKFESKLTIPLREDPKQLLAGVRIGAVHNLGERITPRIGIDIWMPIRLGPAYLGAGLCATLAWSSQAVTDSSGGDASSANWLFIPISLRAGYELFAGQHLSVAVGVGAMATFVRFEHQEASVDEAKWGIGGMAFVSAPYALGPGQIFVDASYAYAPVRGRHFFLNAGGLGAAVGYRFGVL